MTILATVNAAEARHRQLDALSDLVREAQRTATEAQRYVPMTARLQEQVNESFRLAPLSKSLESFRLAAEGTSATTLAMQRFGEQFAASLASLRLSETVKSMQLLTERTNAALLSPQLSKSLESFRFAAEGASATTLAMQRFGEQFAASLAPLRLSETMQIVAQSFRQQLHAAFGFSETTGQKIAELARQLLLSTDRHAAGVLLTRGWLGVERHLTTVQLAKLVRVRGPGKGVEIDRRMCAAFRRNRWARLRSMTKAWKAVPYLNDRRHIIRQAQAAHREERYALSIAALLPLVDGLAAEVRRANMSLVAATSKKRRIIAVNDVVHLYDPAHGRSRQWSAVVLTAVSERIFKDYDFDTQRAPAKNNRHGVLHGRIPRYASEKYSLQTFLLLDVMACIAANNP